MEQGTCFKVGARVYIAADKGAGMEQNMEQERSRQNMRIYTVCSNHKFMEGINKWR
ncbi:MAG: hypothetical protein K6F00_02310 [Lachnospiraceae bacterium]|nr:hypothetical protein [Lachnospiraceae bacterium]